MEKPIFKTDSVFYMGILRELNMVIHALVSCYRLMTFASERSTITKGIGNDNEKEIQNIIGYRVHKQKII